jgi:exosortase A
VRHRPLVALAALPPLLLLLALLWPFLHFIWADRVAYSHGYLVLGVAAWLGYRAARSAPLPPLAPSWLGGAALVVAVGLAGAGSAADVALLPQLAIPALPLATLWALGGAAAARRFVVPFGYLIFALPIWDPLNEPLRRLTTAVAGSLTRLASIPAYIEGDVIRIPAGTFVVEGGCSGLHFLIVACALSTLWALLAYDRWPPRVLAVLVAAFVSMVANWVRVFGIILAGHLTDMQHYLVTVDHVMFGWAVFFAFLGPALLVGRHLEGRLVSSRSAAGKEPGRASPPDAASVASASVACAIVLSVGAGLVYRATNRPAAAEIPTVTFGLPSALGAWQAVGDWSSATRPRFAGADAVASGSYRLRGDSAVADLYLAHYSVQQQGKEAVFYANTVAGDDVEVLERGPLTVPWADGKLVMMEAEVGGATGPRRVVWYGYRVAGRATASAFGAKLYQALGVLEGRWDAQVLVASARCEPADCGAARESLRRLMIAAEHPLRTLVDEHSRKTA